MVKTPASPSTSTEARQVDRALGRIRACADRKTIAAAMPTNGKA
jgi:hypothetical protein